MNDGEQYTGEVGSRVSFHGLLIDIKSFNTEFGKINKYIFADLDENVIVWFTKKNIKFVKGERYPISGIVKKQEVDFYTKLPTTTIKNAKLEKM